MVKKRTLVLLTFFILMVTLMTLVPAFAAEKAVQPKQIDITGSPFKGPADAPVVMIVFDDFE